MVSWQLRMDSLESLSIETWIGLTDESIKMRSEIKKEQIRKTIELRIEKVGMGEAKASDVVSLLMLESNWEDLKLKESAWELDLQNTDK